MDKIQPNTCASFALNNIEIKVLLRKRLNEHIVLTSISVFSDFRKRRQSSNHYVRIIVYYISED